MVPVKFLSPGLIKNSVETQLLRAEKSEEVEQHLQKPVLGCSEEDEGFSTWFWFRLISMVCSSDTSKGTFWILLRDRSSRSRFLRDPSPVGNSDI